MQHDKYAIYMILLVAIVGVVSMAGLIKGGMTDLTGQAVDQIFFQQCTETGDTGIDYYTWGDVTGYTQYGYGPHTWGDKCIGDKIVEYYCHQNGYATYSKVDCPAGYSCSGGVCVGEEEAPTGCTETGDTGIDYYTYGEVEGYTQTGIGPYTWSDKCISGQIVEYYCHPDNYITYDKVDCPNNGVCSGGVCSQPQAGDPDFVITDITFLGAAYGNVQGNLSTEANYTVTVENIGTADYDYPTEHASKLYLYAYAYNQTSGTSLYAMVEKTPSAIEQLPAGSSTAMAVTLTFSNMHLIGESINATMEFDKFDWITEDNEYNNGGDSVDTY